jgi:alpha-ribazole phosphatase
VTRLVLIRHGETDWNTEGRYQGHTDVPLNTRGREQAEAMAEALKDWPLQAIYTSDLKRARDTAEILAAATGAPMHMDPRLREIDLGEWEGRLSADIQRTDGDLLARRRADPLDTFPSGGEGVRQVMARVVPLLDEIARQHPDSQVALVSHGTTLAAIKVHLLHLPLERLWDLEPKNAAVEEIVVEAA